MKDKKCNGCKEGKIDSKHNKSGLCTKCSQKKWNEQHKEEVKAYHRAYKKKYYQEHREEIYDYKRKNPDLIYGQRARHYNKHSERNKKISREWYEENKEYAKSKNLEYSNKRYKEDEAFRIRKLLGSALSSVIKYYLKTGKIANRMQKYNIDWKGIIKQLKPFPKNRKLYHIDHIIPLYKFDLTNWEQIHIAFAPENHRWILAKENLKRDKKDKIVPKGFRRGRKKL